MPIEYKTRVAHLRGTVGVDEAESLLQWVQETPAGSLNLKLCEHIHSAVLQAILYVRPKISREPEQQELMLWLQAAGLLEKGDGDG